MSGAKGVSANTVPALPGSGLVTTDALGMDPLAEELTSGLGHDLALEHVRLRSSLGHGSPPPRQGLLLPFEGQ